MTAQLFVDYYAIDTNAFVYSLRYALTKKVFENPKYSEQLGNSVTNMKSFILYSVIIISDQAKEC